MRLSSWLTFESRCEMRSLRRRFFNVNVLFFVRILRRERENDSIEKTSTRKKKIRKNSRKESIFFKKYCEFSSSFH
jgi:hypothetical protein